MTVDLRGHLAYTPFDVATLEGLTINIREYVTGEEVLAKGIVTASMIN